MTVPHDLSTWEAEAEEFSHPGLHNLFGVPLLYSALETHQDLTFNNLG